VNFHRLDSDHGHVGRSFPEGLVSSSVGRALDEENVCSIRPGA
jgi:hypothetical protein